MRMEKRKVGLLRKGWLNRIEDIGTEMNGVNIRRSLRLKGLRKERRKERK